MMPSIVTIIPILLIVTVLLTAVYAYRKGAPAKTTVLISVSIIIIGSVLVPFLQEDNVLAQDITSYSTLEYDDYILADNVDTVSGPLELIQIGDHKYVHAIAVGTGAYSIDGKTHDIPVNKAQLDVFLILGQSNAAYFVYDATLASPAPQLGTAYYFGTSQEPVKYATFTDSGDYGMYDMISSERICKIGNIEPSFAAEYTKLTGHKVYMINGAIPGMSILGYSSSGNATIYGKTILDKGIEAIDTTCYDVSIQDVIWIQGEADKDRAPETYRSIFLDLTDALTAGVWGESFRNIVISTTATGGNPTIVQKQLAAENDHIKIGADIASTFTVGNGLMSIDGVHYSQIGDNLIGTKLGVFCA